MNNRSMSDYARLQEENAALKAERDALRELHSLAKKFYSEVKAQMLKPDGQRNLLKANAIWDEYERIESVTK